MAEIIERHHDVYHEPVQTQNSNGLVVGLLIAVIVILFLLLFGRVGRSFLPVGGFGSSTIQVPKQIDVNVNK